MENQKLYDYDSAYSYCRKIAISHYENFPVGSLLIPKNKRKFIYSVYAFARYADDIADSAEFAKEEKIRRLTLLNNELDKIHKESECFPADDTGKILIALSDTVKSLEIPVKEFRDLIKAFVQDSEGYTYKDFEELIEYSRKSANPIGHLVLYIFGYRPEDSEKSEKIFEYSDKICTALQLTNFWQDVSADIRIGRIYLPAEVMNEFKYSTEMLYSGTENEDFRGMIKYLVERTRKLFTEGREILNCTKGRLRLELKAIISGGQVILDKIEKADYNVFSRRPVLNKSDKLKILSSLFFK